jgi:hypothetical protein
MALVAVVVLVGVWMVRPVFHGLAMFLWTKPLVWLAPIVALVVTLVIASRQVSMLELRAGRRPPIAPLVGLGVAFALFVFFGAINGQLVNRSLYTHTTYEQIPGLPAGGKVRLLPKEVAEQIAKSGPSTSPTSTSP